MIFLLFFVFSRRFKLPASPLFNKWPKRQRLFLELGYALYSKLPPGQWVALVLTLRLRLLLNLQHATLMQHT